MQAQQTAHLEAARGLLAVCQPDASQPEFTGVAGFPLISFAGLLLEVRAMRWVVRVANLVCCMLLGHSSCHRRAPVPAESHAPQSRDSAGCGWQRPG